MKVLLINFQRTGDIIQTFHIIHSIKRTIPNSKIFYATNNIHAKSLELIDEYLEGKFIIDYLKIFENIKNNIFNAYSYLKNIISNINEQKFDKIINLNFSILSAIFTNLCRADIKIGAELLNSTTIKIENRYFKELFFNIENNKFNFNIVELYLRGLELPYFPPTTISNFKINGVFQAIIHPGASRKEKKWGMQNYLKLILLLNNHFEGKIRFVITGGGEEFNENQIIYENAKKNGINIENLSGRLDLKEVKNLINISDVVISGDTSIQHIAALTKVKSVVIFLGNAYHFHTFPYSLNKIVIFPDIKCYPCKANYSCSHQKCKNLITPKVVMDAIISGGKNHKNILETFLLSDGYITLKKGSKN